MDFELELGILLDILLSALLGFFIGFERKLRAKEAGIRTHTIVCVGSALMMCISKYGFQGADTSRVAAQIVAGVGFLGAGIIVYRKHEVHGLTTAAGIWATAGIGMACGARLYLVAVGASVVLIGVQFLLHMPWRIFKMKKSYTLKIVFEDCEGSREKIKEMFGFEVYVKLLLERQGERLVYRATINTEKEYRSEFLEKALKENPYILSIERTDDN
ncbi:MAG: MgtC/SapB family protein [Clostridia bacterium]|nr:MgtC/SapB family protein [Clostridia bacterium]